MSYSTKALSLFIYILKQLWLLIISFLLFLSASWSVNAQSIPQAYGELTYSNGRFYADGVRLSDEKLSSLDGFNIGLYTRGRGMVITGEVFMIKGAAYGAVSAYFIVINHMDKSVKPDGTTSGMPQAFALMSGVVALFHEVVGIPLYCVGRHKQRHAADGYDSRKNNVTMSFGQCNSGIGLAVNF